MKKLKILQVIPAFNTGGVEEEAFSVSEALVQAGHASFIASAGGHKQAEAEAGGAIHFTLPLNKKSPFLFFRMIRELVKIIRENNIDIIQARSRWPAWCAYFAAKRCNIPYMTTFHGCHKANSAAKAFYNSIMVRTRHTIAVSNYMNGYILNNYAKTLKKYGTQIHVIPRGIDENRFNPEIVSNQNVDELRADWGLDPQLPLILLPARMTRIKGHHVFIEALSLLKNQNWTAVIVGGQSERMDYQHDIEKRIHELNLNDKVKIIAAIRNIPVAYKMADIIVCPTIEPEAFGRVIIEAQAMGKPIITSNIGEPASLVTHGVNGWQFESRNAVSLAEVISTVLELTEDEKKQYAQGSRDFVLNNYTKNLMCSRTLDVYNTVSSEIKDNQKTHL